MKPIYLVVGVPGAGKSYVCEKLTEKFEYVHHDGLIYLKKPGAYLEAVREAAKSATKPLLIEAPFSVSDTVDPLEADGFEVKQVYILEDPQTVSSRYEQREGKPIPKGHLTRMETYRKRAETTAAFSGTSDEVLTFLQNEPV